VKEPKQTVSRLDPFNDLETGFPAIPTRDRQPRQVLSDKYLPPKMPWLWLTAADALGGSVLAVGLLALRNRAITVPYGWPNRLGLEAGEPFGLGRKAVRLGLRKLADAGLIRVDTSPGCKAVVTIVELPNPDGKPQFIFPKIPFDWIAQAARTPAPGLLVGLAAWRYDHMTGVEGESRFCISPLQGSQRPTASLMRGLSALERAGLVERLESPRGYACLRIVKSDEIR